jgi:transcription antitermination factor NusG
MDEGIRWFALGVKPQHEFKVVEGLKNLPGIEGFLPTYKDKRIWSDRVKVLNLPLFPGYVFARFEYPAQRVPVLRVVGVRSVIGSGAGGTPLPESEINAIQILVNSSFPLRPWPFLQAGNRVRVEHGPLRGVEGTILEQKDEWRMVVSVELLQRSVAVLLDRAQLKRVAPMNIRTPLAGSR